MAFISWRVGFISLVLGILTSSCSRNSFAYDPVKSVRLDHWSDDYKLKFDSANKQLKFGGYYQLQPSDEFEINEASLVFYQNGYVSLHSKVYQFAEKYRSNKLVALPFRLSYVPQTVSPGETNWGRYYVSGDMIYIQYLGYVNAGPIYRPFYLIGRIYRDSSISIHYVQYYQRPPGQFAVREYRKHLFPPARGEFQQVDTIQTYSTYNMLIQLGK